MDFITVVGSKFQDLVSWKPIALLRSHFRQSAAVGDVAKMSAVGPLQHNGHGKSHGGMFQPVSLQLAFPVVRQCLRGDLWPVACKLSF